MFNMTRDYLRTLLKERKPCMVSLYMPTHRKGQEVQQDKIVFKNLIKEVEQSLKDRGDVDVATWLKEAKLLIEDALFWQHQDKGLVLFIEEDATFIHHLPMDVPSAVYIKKQAEIKPLLPLFTDDVSYFLLALSLKETKLFHGNRFGIQAVNLGEIPSNLEDTLIDGNDQQTIQSHTYQAGSQGTYHGQGGAAEDGKEDIIRFFRYLSQGIETMLKQAHVPLILTGVDYLIPLFRETSKYDSIFKTAIEGNPDPLSQETLHKKAIALLEPEFVKKRNLLYDRFESLKGKKSPQALEDIKQVVVAAKEGRIATLFIHPEMQQWGTIHPQTKEVKKHKTQEPGDLDLYDHVVIETILKGGTVFAMKSPLKTGVAAICRF